MKTHFRNHRLTWRRALCALSALALLSASVLDARSAQFPDGFRRWVHVSTGVIMPKTSPQLASEEGMHHIFANPEAVAGYASGRFADGSILVYELRDATQQNGVIVEGGRKRVDVMIKDARRSGDTGGWRFERFWSDGRPLDDARESGAACFQCHSKAGAQGFVFSRLQ
jgi:cytochrome P460